MLGPPRLATAADVPLLAALYADAARTLGPQVYSPAQVVAWASFAADTTVFRDYILSAQTWIIGDPPQAFCGIDAGGEVHSLYVAPARTRQGLGSALLAHAMAQARAQGVTRFSAWATPFSRPVFQRAGLALVQTVTEPYQGVLFQRYRLAST